MLLGPGCPHRERKVGPELMAHDFWAARANETAVRSSLTSWCSNHGVSRKVTGERTAFMIANRSSHFVVCILNLLLMSIID